jgi:hypothetical protein
MPRVSSEKEKQNPKDSAEEIMNFSLFLQSRTNNKREKEASHRKREKSKGKKKQKQQQTAER